MEEVLKIAVQKSGRLNEKSLALLKECGISLDNGKDQLKVRSHSFPVEVLYLRNSDIPQYVVDGVADIGIIGENLVIESECNLNIIEKLGFSKCRLSLAVPKDTNYEGLSFFNGKKLATSYPATLSRFAEKNNLDIDIHKISGSVEITTGIGLADGICDLVSSGSTLFKNGLEEVEVILKSEACVVSSESLSQEKQEILDKLLFRVRAVLKAKNSKYVLLNAPEENLDKIVKVLPGMKSPTVLPLAEKGWCSVHTVMQETDFWNVIDELKNLGAEGILIVPIEKMIL